MTVVGLGIEVPGHVTAETRSVLEHSDDVLYLVADALAASWVKSMNPRSRSLHAHYEPGRARSETYAAIVEEVLGRVRQGGSVCFALYGHPGVYSTIGQGAVRRARESGLHARMLPAVSAEDCLFAELGIDPGRSGWQSYDATDLLMRRRVLDPSAALVIWQAAIVGRIDYAPDGDATRLPLLAEYLEQYYPPEHELVCYAASPYPFLRPVVERFPLARLAQATLPRLSLLYLSPAVIRPPDLRVVESHAAPA